MHSCEFMLFLITLFILNIKAKLMSSIVRYCFLKCEVLIIPYKIYMKLF